MRPPATRTVLVRRGSSNVIRSKNIEAGGISDTVAVAVQLPAAGHDDKIRPNDGAIAPFGTAWFASAYVPGRLWNVKLVSNDQGIGYRPLALYCVPSDHGGLTLQNADVLGVPAA